MTVSAAQGPAGTSRHALVFSFSGEHCSRSGACAEALREARASPCPQNPPPPPSILVRF